MLTCAFQSLKSVTCRKIRHLNLFQTPFEFKINLFYDKIDKKLRRKYGFY